VTVTVTVCSSLTPLVGEVAVEDVGVRAVGVVPVAPTAHVRPNCLFPLFPLRVGRLRALWHGVSGWSRLGATTAPANVSHTLGLRAGVLVPSKWGGRCAAGRSAGERRRAPSQRSMPQPRTGRPVRVGQAPPPADGGAATFMWVVLAARRVAFDHSLGTCDGVCRRALPLALLICTVAGCSSSRTPSSVPATPPSAVGQSLVAPPPSVSKSSTVAQAAPSITAASGPAATTTAAPTPAAPSSSGPSAAATQDRCDIATLAVTDDAGQAAGGRLTGRLTFRNIGEAPCILGGFPGLLRLDSSRRPLRTNVERALTSAPTVTLQSGARASSSYSYPGEAASGVSSCPKPAQYAEVTPPGSKKFIVVKSQLRPCDEAGTISVSPVMSDATP